MNGVRQHHVVTSKQINDQECSAYIDLNRLKLSAIESSPKTVVITSPHQLRQINEAMYCFCGFECIASK